MKYMDGLDRAKGCTSTKADDPSEFLSRREQLLSYGDKKSKRPTLLKKISEWTPGEVLAERRRKIDEKVSVHSDADG